MEGIDSDMNKASPPPEDFALSNGEIAEPTESAPKSTDFSATRSTATIPNPFTVPGTDFGAYKSTATITNPFSTDSGATKSTATARNPFKAPGGASSRANPFEVPQAGGASSGNLASSLSDLLSKSKDLLSQADNLLSQADSVLSKPAKPPKSAKPAKPAKSAKSAKSADGVPKTWRPDLKPMLRYVVQGAGAKSQVKYLTWDQSKGENLGIDRLTGDFFDSDDYLLQEPMLLKDGDWNHATICFFGFLDEEADEFEVVHEVSQYENIVLPTLSEKAIWAEKPSVEWVDLKFWNVKLRDMFGAGTYARRGSLRVVTHMQFEVSNLEMVMKIWPTPMCSTLGLENEMMVYRACDGLGITPEFVAYVTEEGRVIGMLTKYHGEAHKPKNHEEKELCRTALHTFQTLTGWQRKPRANHKDNYLIEDGKVLLIDLASVYPPEELTRKGNDFTQKLLHEDFDAYWDHKEHISK